MTILWKEVLFFKRSLVHKNKNVTMDIAGMKTNKKILCMQSMMTIASTGITQNMDNTNIQRP